jgi:hypothetical protein
MPVGASAPTLESPKVRSRAFRLFGVFVAVSVATRWLSLVVEVLDHDEACHFIGARVLASGQLLYTDFVDNKPPLLYVFYAIAELLGGHGLLGVHLLTVLLVVPLTALAVSAFHDHARAGVAAGIAFVVYGAAFLAHDMLATNAEILMALPAAWAFVLLRRVPPGPAIGRGLLAGVLFGTAVLVKPQAGVWAVVGAVAWLDARRAAGRAGRGVAVASALVVGSLVPAAVVYAWFAARGGAAALVYWTVLNNFSYVENPITAREALERLAAYFLPFLVVTAPLWWGCLAGARLHEDRYRRRLVLGLVALSIAPACLGFRFFPHYFVQLYVPLALAAGPWLAAVVRRPLPRSGRVVVAWSAAMLVGFTVANAALYLGPLRVYRERDPVFRRVADRLRADPCPGPVFVWGWSPTIYYYAGLPLASRFAVLPPARLTGYVPGNTASERGEATPGEIVSRHWDWLMEDLERTRPTLVVDTAPANLFRWGRYPIARYPRLQEYIDREFEPAGAVEGVRIYRRRGCAVPPGGSVRAHPRESYFGGED